MALHRISNFALIVYLTLGLALPCQAGEAAKCVINRLEEIHFNGGKPVTIHQIVGIEKHAQDNLGDEVNITEALGGTNHVIFGFAPEHAFLYVNGTRFHGKMSYFGEGPRVIKKNSSFIKDGTWFEFEDLPPQVVEAFREGLLKKAGTPENTFTCITSACAELKAATGIRPAGGSSPLPASLVENILTHGFVHADGSPVKVTLYRTNYVSFQEITDNFKAMQTPYTGTLRLVVVIVPLFGYIGYKAYVGIQDARHDP